MQSTIAYSRKLVALGRLTAGIAHEVKNPLNAMMIHLELLRTKIRKSALVPAGGGGLLAETARADEGLLQHVEVIETEIRRLDEVVQGFLKFTRPEDLRLQAVRVSALFDELLPLIQPEARKHDVRVVVETPDDQLAVNGDAGDAAAGDPESGDQCLSGDAQRRNASADARLRPGNAGRAADRGHRRRHPPGAPRPHL